jgi:Conserved TM helix
LLGARGRCKPLAGLKIRRETMELAFDDMSKVVAAYVPNLLGALAILTVGWLVARIIAAIVTGTLRNGTG